MRLLPCLLLFQSLLYAKGAPLLGFWQGSPWVNSGLLVLCLALLALCLRQGQQIRRHKEAEQSLQDSEQFFETLFQSASQAMFLLRQDLSIERMNKAAQQYTAIRNCIASLSNGRPCGLLSNCEACQIRQALLTTRETRNSLSGLEVELPRPDQPIPFTYLLYSTYMASPGRLFVMLQDITTLKDSQRQLQHSLQERESLIHELYHRTRNNMNIVAAMVELQFDDAEAPIALKAQAIVSRIFTMALVHDMLWQSQNLSSIPLDQYLEKLVQHIRSLYPANNRVEIITHLQPYITILWDQAIPCGLIVNELLGNCLRHAFPAQMSGAVHLHMRQSGTDQLMLQIIDNGVGMPEMQAGEASDGMGLSLARSLAEHQLRGHLHLESSPRGLHISVLIPLYSYNARV